MSSSRSNLALIVLNVAWLAAGSYLVARHLRTASSGPVQYVTNYVPIAKSTRVTVVTNVIPATTNEFAWIQLESEDYRTYIERLRAIGCPEQTIRDIIIADVDKLMAPRLQAASLQPRDLKYWEPIDQEGWDTAAQRDAFLKQRTIDFQKREVIRELLGIDLVGERLRSTGQDDYHGARLQFLPDDKRARVRLVLDQYADQERQLLEQQVDDSGQVTGTAELKQLQREKDAAVSQLLTPHEREQYDLWFSAAAARTRETIYGMQASEEEFLKIYQLEREFDQQAGDRPATPEVAQAHEARLQSVLGDERYAAYLRSRDPEFRALYAATSRFGLPAQRAAELYGFKQAAAEQWTQVEADQNLTSAQKQAAYNAIVSETQSSFKEVLGERAFRYFQGRVPQAR